MENNNSNSGSKFFNGFLLGALIGGGIVFLLGTKKGKKLLKAISEEGLGNISNILDEADNLQDIDDIEDVDKVMPQKNSITEDQTSEAKPKVRRFFRGITRRLN
ncbi:MAG: hypothetical protein AAB583_06705 [Patescibacteria group bacterium]